MNLPLRDAYQAAESRIPSCGDASTATAVARRRRLGALLAVPVVIGLVVSGGAAVVAGLPDNEPPKPSSTWETAPATDNPTSTPSEPAEQRGARLDSPEGPGSVIYRSCGDNGCSVTVVNNGLGARDAASLHPVLVEALADRDLDGVTLGYDAGWIGVPGGTGFTLYNLYDQDATVDLPAGPAGSRWEAYYWGTDFVHWSWRSTSVTASRTTPSSGSGTARSTIRRSS